MTFLVCDVRARRHRYDVGDVVVDRYDRTEKDFIFLFFLQIFLSVFLFGPTCHCCWQIRTHFQDFDRLLLVYHL